jgi:PKD repeat protein
MRRFRRLTLAIGLVGLSTACGEDANAPSNSPPTANFSASCTDLTCSFTDLSSDGDGTVVGFDWNFGDGAAAATKSSTHAYASPGTYKVELTVADNSGATSSLSLPVAATAHQAGGQGVTASVELNPTSFDFAARSFLPDPQSQLLSITSNGTGPLTWTASSNQSWLRIWPTGGTTPSPNVAVSVSTTGLTRSFYQGLITISATGASNATQTILVTLYRR